MGIQGILFDIGDTLLNATRLQKETLEYTANILASEKLLPDPKKFIDEYQSADREPQFDEMPDLNHLYSDKRIVERAFERLSWVLPNKLISRFLEIYRNKLRADVRPDVALTATLDKLKAMNYQLGILSNGTTKDQLEQLSLLAIKDYFNPVLISEEVGIRKPDTRIFLLAADKWQIAPDKILVVGDRGDWDVIGAHRAGMKSALTTQFVDQRDAIQPGNEPDLIIKQVSDLPRVLDVSKLNNRKIQNSL